MLQPKNVSLLLPFFLHCLHLPRGLVNFVLMCRLMLATLIPATPLPHEGARFLLEKSPISFSAIDKLQSTIEKCFVGFLLPGVSKKECVDQRNFKNIVDQILPKLFGWTANWTLGSVLLCSVYTIVVLLVVLNCRRALNDDNTTTPNPSLSWAISERVRCCICNVNLKLNLYEK